MLVRFNGNLLLNTKTFEIDELNGRDYDVHLNDDYRYKVMSGNKYLVLLSTREFGNKTRLTTFIFSKEIDYFKANHLDFKCDELEIGFVSSNIEIDVDGRNEIYSINKELDLIKVG